MIPTISSTSSDWMLALNLFPEDGLWNIIPKIASPFALTAFLVAIAFMLVRSYYAHKIELIKLAPEKTRANIIQELAGEYGISAEGLTTEQRYTLVLAALRARALRFMVFSVVAVVLAFILAGLVGLAILHNTPPPPTSKLSLGDAILYAKLPDEMNAQYKIIQTSIERIGRVKRAQQEIATLKTKVASEKCFFYMTNACSALNDCVRLALTRRKRGATGVDWLDCFDVPLSHANYFFVMGVQNTGSFRELGEDWSEWKGRATPLLYPAIHKSLIEIAGPEEKTSFQLAAEEAGNTTLEKLSVDMERQRKKFLDDLMTLEKSGNGRCSESEATIKSAAETLDALVKQWLRLSKHKTAIIYRAGWAIGDEAHFQQSVPSLDEAQRLQRKLDKAESP